MNGEFTYVYSHSLNGKIFYIGVGSRTRTSSFYSRNEKWHDFVKDLKDDVIVNIMLKTRNRKEGFDYEREMIIKHKPYANYYDGTPSGHKHPMYGKKHTKETRELISLAKKGENNHMYGKKHKKETRELMSLAAKGENNHMYGKKHKKETRELMSLAAKGRKHSDKTKIKMSLAKKGENAPMYDKKHTKEARHKMRKNRKNMTRVEINDGEKSFIVNSMAEASRITGIKHSTIKNQTRNGKICIKENITIKRIGA